MGVKKKVNARKSLSSCADVQGLLKKTVHFLLTFFDSSFSLFLDFFLNQVFHFFGSSWWTRCLNFFGAAIEIQFLKENPIKQVKKSENKVKKSQSRAKNVAKCNRQKIC